MAAPGDPFTDPDEPFDVYRSDGTPTGRVKRRADVHRDGDWHRAFHCWVTCLAPHPPTPPPAARVPVQRREGEELAAAPAVLSPASPAPVPDTLLILQRRGLQKDTWPGRLDASVGGHYRAGETLADVIREVEEEIGQPARLTDLLPLGRRRTISEAARGPRDRELQDVFLWRTSLPLNAFRPQPGEVVALEGVRASDLLRLFADETERVPVLALDPSGAITPQEIGRPDFVPSFDSYVYRVAVAVDLAQRGYPYLVV